MTDKTVVTALALLSLALPVQQAFAHATLETGQVAANTTYKAVMRIPHGCDGLPTNAVTIDIPEGVIAAKPMPKAGWTLEVERGAYATTYDYYGTPMSEGVRRIRWSGGELPDAFYDEFVFRARVTGGLAGRSVAFPTVQDCPDGQQVAWVEIPAAGQDPHALAHPAPMLQVADAKHDAHSHNHGSGHAANHGTLTVEAPFARASAGRARNGAAFLTVSNASDVADRLIAVRSDVAERTELHTHLNENGVMRMREVEAIDVPANGAATLAPGGDHVMFMGLKAPLKEGESFPLTLVFEKAGDVTVTVTVGPVGAMGGHGDHGSHGGGHGHGSGHGTGHNHTKSD